MSGCMDCIQTCSQQGEPGPQILFSVLSSSLQTGIEDREHVQRKEMELVKGLEDKCDEEQLRDLALFSPQKKESYRAYYLSLQHPGCRLLPGEISLFLHVTTTRQE